MPQAFSQTNQSWAPLGASSSSCPPLSPTTAIDIISWNIDLFASHNPQRHQAALRHIAGLLPSPPRAAIIHLQETTAAALSTLAADGWVREHFLLSHHPDGGCYGSDDEQHQREHYFTTTLISRHLPVARILRHPFRDTTMGRDVLIVDIPLSCGIRRSGGAGGGGGTGGSGVRSGGSRGDSGTVRLLRVANTHLESGVWLRPAQLRQVAALLGGATACVVAGDMNAHLPEDGGLPGSVGFRDVWELQMQQTKEAMDEAEGHTWGFQGSGGNSQLDEVVPRRLDKVLFTGDVEFLGVAPEGTGRQGRLLQRIGVGLKYLLPNAVGDEEGVYEDDEDYCGDDDNWVSDHVGLRVRVRAGGGRGRVGEEVAAE